MGYLKAVILAVVVAVFTVFILQNIAALSYPVELRLNLYFKEYVFSPLAVYMVTFIAFFIGLLLASIIGIFDRFRMRRALRRSHKEIRSLQSEVRSLRNIPLHDPLPAREEEDLSTL